MLCAKNIMHPRKSIQARDRGTDIVKKLTAPYPALPVVNDNLEVIGIVSEYDVLSVMKEGRTLYEFDAESIMSCGHAEHGVCERPVTVMPETPIDDVLEILHSLNFTVLPVVEHNKLVGIISRKQIIDALAEPGLWPEHEFQKRIQSTKIGAGA